MAKKPSTPALHIKIKDVRVEELRDPRTHISTENHLQMTNRLLSAANVGIHGTPGKKKGEK